MNQLQEKKFKPTTEAFYDQVRAEFNKMISVKKKGVPVFSQEYIFNELAEKFFRSPKTIENIVFSRVRPKRPARTAQALALA